MKVIIPSKDRTMQLHLLLESIDKNFAPLESLDVCVIYTYSNERYFDGYKKLIERFDQRGVSFLREYKHKEGAFHDILLEELRRAEWDEEIVGLFTDDAALYRKATIDPYLLNSFLKIDKKLLCFSMRLGENTIIQDYTTGAKQFNLQSRGGARKTDDFGYIYWPWTVHPRHYNYGYIFSWDGHIYRAEDLYGWLKEKTFNNPRSVEHQIVTDATIYDKLSLERPYMMAETESTVFCNTINAVQDKHGPPAGLTQYYDEQELNDQYLRGEVVDLEAFMSRCEEIGIRSSHYEVPLEFKRYGN